MAAIVTNYGLQRIGVQASQATGTGVVYSATRHIQTMAWDDLSGSPSFLAAHDQLTDAGAITNEYDQAFDATPIRTNQTVQHISTIPTTQGNFTIRRVSMHDDTATNVTTTSTTLVCGVDGQTLGKTSDFSLATYLNLIYTNV